MDNVIHLTITEPAQWPAETHVHRWAWCQRIDGAEVQRCYDCGRVR